MIIKYGAIPPLEATFDASFINWHSPKYDDELIEHMKFTFKVCIIITNTKFIINE